MPRATAPTAPVRLKNGDSGLMCLLAACEIRASMQVLETAVSSPAMPKWRSQPTMVSF
jgi:hypothetical protein